MKHTRKIFMLLLGAVLVFSLTMTTLSLVQSRRARQSYAQARELVILPARPAQRWEQTVDTLEESSAEPPAESPSEFPAQIITEESVDNPVELPPEETAAGLEPWLMSLEQLRAVNGEVMGWITLPGTTIDYPLLDGADNAYYLWHSWDRQTNLAGSIFLEEASSPDLGDFNTILYGHRMADRSMFSTLDQYSSQNYWEEHREVHLSVESGLLVYEIFAAYEVPVRSYTYQIAFRDDGEKETFLSDCLGRSVIDTGIVPTVDDHILTLSTCTGRGHDTRWVVQARLIPEE